MFSRCGLNQQEIDYIFTLKLERLIVLLFKKNTIKKMNFILNEKEETIERDHNFYIPQLEKQENVESIALKISKERVYSKSKKCN